MLDQLKQVLSRHHGKVPVFLSFLNPAHQQVELQVAPDYYTEPSEKLITDIEDVLGEGVVTLRK